MNTPTLLVHGGAWAIPDDMIDAHKNGVSNALAIGYALLQDGATAVEAVEAAVTILEDDETFDAGRGSFLTRDGRVQLDALLMDGSNLRAGGGTVGANPLGDGIPPVSEQADHFLEARLQVG